MTIIENFPILFNIYKKDIDKLVFNMSHVIGIDIGGTKVAAAVCTEDGKLLKKVEVPSVVTNRENMYRCVEDAVKKALEINNLKIDNIVGIGAGVPGKLDREKGIAIYQNNLPWRNFPIKERLKESFHIDNIVIDNDVYMAALAEWSAAGKKNNETFTYITISTGICSATILNGSFLRGAGFAGEIGLFPISNINNGPVRRLEYLASGVGLQKEGGVVFNNPNLETKDIFQMYQLGNKEAKMIIEHAADYISRGVYAIICILNPHQIYFGGSVMIHNRFFLGLIANRLEKLVIEEQNDILNNLFISTLGQDNGIVGASLRVLHNME